MKVTKITPLFFAGIKGNNLVVALEIANVAREVVAVLRHLVLHEQVLGRGAEAALVAQVASSEVKKAPGK